MILPFTDLQFLRPAWLLALPLLPLLAWAWRQRARRRSAWRAAVDPHLLPRLLEARSPRRRVAAAGPAVLLGLALVVLALAAPSWRSVPQPLQAGGSALVIAIDLSSAVLANDLPPSRLVQARARIEALLDAHPGEVALVAYADDAFVVSPVTVDAANVAVFLDALAPDVMPVDGDRPERAIELAGELLAGAGHAGGDILLLAPDAGRAAVRAAARAAAEGHRVSVLAMGTADGAGYRGRDGAIRHSALDPTALAAVAAAGGGRVYDWATPPAQLAVGLDGAAGAPLLVRDAAGLVREDGGYWLLPAALVLLLAAFRRGGVLAALALCLLLPVLPPQPALAADAPTPPEGSLWQRPDQVAHARSAAAEAAYRAGDYEAAAKAFATLPGADAAYNRGNALARAGRYREALAAYDQALEDAPGMADAEANRRAVEAAMRRQPPPPGGGGAGQSPPSAGQGGDPGADPGKRGEQGQGQPDADPGHAPEPDASGDPPPGSRASGDEDGEPPPAEPADPAAPARQQAADAAQREAMQRALDARAQQGGGAGDDGRDVRAPARSTADEEREQANAAWLRRVPDDPGALLRARFRNEHLRRRAEER